MSDKTKIEWCHATFNPIRGCSKVHTGCLNCYAEKNVGVKMQGIEWGEVWQGGQRVVAADSAWKHPLKWARAAARAGERHRVFCASLADVLEVPDYPKAWPRTMTGAETAESRDRVLQARNALGDARSRLWHVIRRTARYCVLCEGRGFTGDSDGEVDTSRSCAGCYSSAPLPGLDWLLLSKRPENWRLVPEDVRPLVWLGTSVSDQKTADEWVPRLLAAEGFRLRFLSVEPLVGPVNLASVLIPDAPSPPGRGNALHACRGFARGIDWVIVGGESGRKARPCDVAWVRDIVRQCREAGVPCFVKQLGSAPRSLPTHVSADGMTLLDAKGGDIAEWPAYIRVRELPGGV
jgi:protein gp37